jgi:hypothetical protein
MRLRVGLWTKLCRGGKQSLLPAPSNHRPLSAARAHLQARAVQASGAGLQWSFNEACRPAVWPSSRPSRHAVMV